MPHSNDGETIRAMFGPRLANALAEQHTLHRSKVELNIRHLERQVHTGTENPKVYVDLAGCYLSLGDYGTALDTLRVGVRRFPLLGEIHYALLRRLHKCGLDEEALAAGERACKLVPDDFALRLEYYLYLPKLYDSEQDIVGWHRRFAQGLEKCIAECDLQTVDGALNAARGLSRFAPFYLAYQGFDDLPLLCAYGEFVHSVMSAAYPQWSNLANGEQWRDRSKRRVGYVSAYFRRHTVGEHFLGWLTQRNRHLYETHCYYVAESRDSVTEQYRRASDVFFQSRDLETVCKAIQRDQPDVLVFTDVGMEPISSQIAALRLAPVQCVTYGHPVTTGLPSIDYFLSGDLMEPPNAQAQYTEKLIRLPNLGIRYSKPAIPRALLTKSRADFGLPGDAVIYLCCQSLFKFLPQYDHLFADIARAIPNARFLFIAPNDLLGRKFRERLDQPFSGAHLRVMDFCQFLPEQNTFDYWNLHFISDVFLDTVGWSGGRTTLDAIACKLPIVTLPGQCMRQRQSTAMLELLGVHETIAKNEAEYVSLAIRLGKEASWRRAVTAKMLSAQHLVFSDDSSVRALGSFFSQALREVEPD
jgi:protein O-GlcNAc transferase